MKKKKNGAMHTILGNKIDYDTYKTSKQVTKVMYEKNLTKFNFLEDNRDIIEAKVDSLVESIRRKVVRHKGYISMIKNSDALPFVEDVFTINIDRFNISQNIKKSFDPKKILNPGKMYTGI